MPLNPLMPYYDAEPAIAMIRDVIRVAYLYMADKLGLIRDNANELTQGPDPQAPNYPTADELLEVLKESGLTPFHSAIIGGDLVTAARYLKYINAQTTVGDTALMLAANLHQPKRVEWLLKHGADAALKDIAGNRAINCAIMHENIHDYYALLQFQINKHAANPHYTWDPQHILINVNDRVDDWQLNKESVKLVSLEQAAEFMITAGFAPVGGTQNTKMLRDDRGAEFAVATTGGSSTLTPWAVPLSQFLQSPEYTSKSQQERELIVSQQCDSIGHYIASLIEPDKMSLNGRYSSNGELLWNRPAADTNYDYLYFDLAQFKSAILQKMQQADPKPASLLYAATAAHNTPSLQQSAPIPKPYVAAKPEL